MVYLIINRLGFNCSYTKVNCPNTNKTCRNCVVERLKKMGFEINSDTRIYSRDSDETISHQLKRDLIWEKFLDVLNIKHVIIMDKNSGVALLNYPVSATDIDSELLSGFIQANITFAESNKGLNVSSSSEIEQVFYELQYKKFNILLKSGDYVRICMILDHKASNNMKTNVSKFQLEFETRFQNQLITLQKTGSFNSSKMIDFIISSFNINLVFPMTLVHAIPPEVLEKIDNNKVQKVILNFAKEFLSTKPFFYINNLLDKVKRIVNLKANILLYDIYQLFEKGVIITTPLETIVSKLESIQSKENKRATEIKPISLILASGADMNLLKEKITTMDENSAKNVIKSLIKRGKSAEKSSTYDISLMEYNKALYVAKKFNLKQDMNKISNILFETDKKAKQIELDFVLKTGENAEKNKDSINAIFYYQKGLKILEGFLIYDDSSESRIKKLRKKIIKLREIM